MFDVLNKIRKTLHQKFQFKPKKRAKKTKNLLFQNNPKHLKPKKRKKRPKNFQLIFSEPIISHKVENGQLKTAYL